MYDSRKIIPALAIFVALITSPMWLSHGRPAAPDLKIDTPAIRKLAERRCVEPAEYMKANHMQLVDSWKDEVVRHGKREYTAGDGRVYEMSLSRTCLHCHSNKERFCDRCHEYQGVKPDCWSCHVVPKEKG